MRGLGQWSERYVDVVEHDLLLTMVQLIPQATREQGRMQLLEKICDNFKKVCNSMNNIHKDTVQHIEDISSCSDSPLFICNYSSVSGLEYLRLSREDLQFQGTHRNLSRSSSAQLILRGNGIAYQASSVEARRGWLDPLSGAESLGYEWP